MMHDDKVDLLEQTIQAAQAQEKAAIELCAELKTSLAKVDALKKEMRRAKIWNIILSAIYLVISIVFIIRIIQINQELENIPIYRGQDDRSRG